MIPLYELKKRLRSPLDGPLTKEFKSDHESVRNHYLALSVWLDENIEDGPSKDKMMDSLEESSLWAHHAMFYKR